MQTNETPKNTLPTNEFRNNPYPVYEKLRQSEPIRKLMFPNGQYGWLISSYDDAVTVLKDPRFIKDMTKLGYEHDSVFSKNMLLADPLDHQRLRGLVQKGFTPQMIAGMRSRI